MDMTISWTHIIAVATFVIGSWVAVRNSMQTRLNAIDVKLARMDEKFDSLAKNVERHNHVSERMGVMEEHQKTLWIRQDELRDRVEKLEK